MAVLQAHRPHMDDSVDYNAPSSNMQDEDMTSNVVRPSSHSLSTVRAPHQLTCSQG